MKCTIKKMAIITALFIAITLGAVPGTINFQGALKDADGVPVNDTKYIIFRIYDDPDTGTLLWSEDHAAVVISAGIFSEELGVAEPFPADLFDNTVLYITFYVGGEEMTPRKKLLSVPYTLQAENAENAGTIEDVALAGLVQQDGSGNAEITGTMTADAFVGDGSGLTNLSGAFDPIYVNTAGPDTMTANTSVGVLNIENTDSYGKGINILDAGDGVYVDNANNDGVYVNSAGDDGVSVNYAGDDGFNVYHAGNPSTHFTNSYKNGFEVAGAQGNGLYVGRADLDGVYVHSVGDDGFYVYNAGTPSTQTVSSSKNGFEVAGAERYGLYVGRADNDGVYVNSAGDDGVYVYNAGNPTTQTVSSYKNGFEVSGAEGHGLYVGQADDDGVYVNSTGNDGVSVNYAGDDGVYVYNAGNPTTQTISTGKNGFEVAGAEKNGLYVGRADWYGVYVNSAYDAGVYVNSVNYRGVYVHDAGSDGFNVYNAGTPSTQTVSYSKNGFEVAGAEGNGLYVGRADEDGVYVSQAGGYGVYANTTVTNGYGFYTLDRTYSGGGYYPARSGTFGRNTGSGTLEAGDLVCISGGYEENVLGEDGVPVVNIEKANSRNSKAIFGVVEYKVHIREEIEEFEDGKTEIQKSFCHTDGNVMPGDHLAIIVFGTVDVKVDSRAGIKIGEKLTVSDNGDARSINDDDNWRIGILGKALEDSNGKGKIKVYVNCK